MYYKLGLYERISSCIVIKRRIHNENSRSENFMAIQNNVVLKNRFLNAILLF